ncbi:hypothetical protein CPB85DRAFT_1289384 [Mucidula mucida]|nr:hypothetical protein CPB85DRAFT_1289384 [Mucidula mucida]
MSSFLTRLWRTIRHPTGFVGRDLEGNLYFERKNPVPEARRPKRTVKYHSTEMYWDYIGGRRRLPAQWSAWLSHTRIGPPSMEELQLDWARQQKLKMNVAMIEQRDREDRLRFAEPSINPNHEQPTSPEPVQAQTPPTVKELPKMPAQDNYEPEVWAPRARTRGT